MLLSVVLQCTAYPYYLPKLVDCNKMEGIRMKNAREKQWIKKYCHYPHDKECHGSCTNYQSDGSCKAFMDSVKRKGKNG